MSTVTPKQVLTVLKTKFDMGELEMLAFELGIPFEDLGGNGRSGKALALLQYSQRHSKYDDLVQAIIVAHPDLDWGGAKPTITNSKSTASDQQQTQPTQIIHNYGTMITGDTNTTVGGDNITGDKTGGDKTSIRDISDSSGIAVGKDSSAEVTTEVAAPAQDTKQQPATEIHVHGNVIGGVVGGGTVNAENIAGGDININSPQEFQEQLNNLATLIKEAIAAGEISGDDAESVLDDVQDATKEAAKEKPSTRRLTGRLEYVQEVLDKAAGVAEAAGKVGNVVLKAAPIVAGLVKAVSIVF